MFTILIIVHLKLISNNCLLKLVSLNCRGYVTRVFIKIINSLLVPMSYEIILHFIFYESEKITRSIRSYEIHSSAWTKVARSDDDDDDGEKGRDSEREVSQTSTVPSRISAHSNAPHQYFIADILHVNSRRFYDNVIPTVAATTTTPSDTSSPQECSSEGRR